MRIWTSQMKWILPYLDSEQGKELCLLLKDNRRQVRTHGLEAILNVHTLTTNNMQTEGKRQVGKNHQPAELGSCDLH